MRKRVIVVLLLLVPAIVGGVFLYHTVRRLSVWDKVVNSQGHLTTSSGDAVLSSRLDFGIHLSDIVAVDCIDVAEAHEVLEMAWNSPQIEGIALEDCGLHTIGSLPLSTTLRSLLLRRNPISDDSIHEMCQAAPNLQALNLADSEVSDKSGKSIAGLSKLQGLMLPRTQVSDKLMAELSLLDSLQVVDVSGTELTSNAFEHLPKSVSVLRVSDTHVGDSNAAVLSTFKNLECIDVSGCTVSDAVIVALSKCSQLDTVVACRTRIDGNGFEAFAKHNKLATLHLDECDLTSDGLMKILGSIPALEHLSLVNCELSKQKINIGSESDLTHVDLTNATVSANFIRALTSCKRLTVLNLSGATLDSEALQAVSTLPAQVQVDR